MYTIDEVFADPQVQPPGDAERIDHAVRGAVDVLRNPITMSRSRTAAPTTSPRPGRPLADVLADLGLADET